MYYSIITYNFVYFKIKSTEMLSKKYLNVTIFTATTT